MVKYCTNCGKPIDDDANFCEYCSKKVNNTNSNFDFNQNNSINMKPNFNNNPQVNTFNLKVMAPSKYLVYCFCTFGIYGLYWFYKNNKMLREAFYRNVSAGLRTIGLFIPIVNLIMIYLFYRDLHTLLKERGIETFSLAGYFLASIFGLHAIMSISLQDYINDLCIYENPNIKVNKKITNAEIVLMIIMMILAFIIIIIFILAIYNASRPHYYYY